MTFYHSMDRDEVLEMIRTTVRVAEPDAEKILYGSRARGTAREDSYVVVLLNKPPMSHHKRCKTANELCNKGVDVGEEISTLVYTADRWRDVSMSLFKHNVKEDGIRL